MQVAERVLQPFVLVVENEPLVRLVLVDELTEAGFHVIEAETGDDGVRELERHPRVRALLTDIEVPGDVDGLALAHITTQRYPDAAVLVVSGQKFPSVGELPANARFFKKPYRYPDLVAALNEMMHWPAMPDAGTGASAGRHRDLSPGPQSIAQPVEPGA